MIINALTHVGDLHVIARTSAFAYKGKSVTVAEIGRDLNVETILEGSVRKAGNKLRITAQLVDTTSGHHIWSERYDRQMGDVFAIQDEMTSAIVNELKPKLLGQEKARLAYRQTVYLEANHLYLKGLYFRAKRNEIGVRKAIEYFEQAIERDPNYPLAYAGLALSYSLLPLYSSSPPKDAILKAKEIALRALQIDEALPEAHASLGFIKTWYDWDWEGAESRYKRAIELNPGYANAHQWYSFCLMFRARFDEAIKEIEKALELDPVSVVINRDLGIVYYYATQFDHALEVLKRAAEMDPSQIYIHFHLGAAYFSKSMYEEALIEYQKEREVSRGAYTWVETYIALTYPQMGRTDEAQKVLDNVLERSKHKYVSPFVLACLHIVVGKNDEGFKLLNKAYEEHDQWLCWLKISPLFDSVRSDPKYNAILKKMNLDR